MDDEATIARGREARTGGTPPGRSRGRLADEAYDTLLGQLEDFPKLGYYVS
ncbi:hypothetical protein [Microbispora sp. H10670]|uniref:hypothetical protein n=1 Tax=Microbispora sp. H10670 TaxID=2729108 RepID=UPI001C71B1FF|nr:hypothetical protein [Microbispora sp. H10670]